MIDHLSLPVADIDRSRRFYDAALEPLGARRAMDMEEPDYLASGWGQGSGEPAFWVGSAKPGQPAAAPVPPDGFHIAFHAASRGAVDAFHCAALAAGGTDNGPPGLRPHYHEHYYAAFVIDPDGYRLEAVCHRPE